MSNPRLIAEDIARDFDEHRNPHLPHAKNIRKHLRKSVLAVTRRILLPRLNYDDETLVTQGIGNENFGEKTSVDPTVLKGKEGLDWRDYLAVDLSASRSQDIETDLSFSETETETEIVKRKKEAANLVPEKYMKLTRRSLSRMEAFLASCAYALPNDAVSSVIRTKDPIRSVVPNLKALASSMLGGKKQKLLAAKQKQTASKNKTNETSIADGLAGLDVNDGVTSSPTRNKSKPGADKSRTYPQMHSNDMILRLELYIRTLRRVYISLHPKIMSEEQTLTTTTSTLERKPFTGECVIHLEPPRAMNTRIKFIVNSLVSTVGSVGSMTFILTNLLVHFTREQLAVELLSDDLQSHIRKICLEYEHMTSFASLAFLSTPGDSAETQLAPMLLKYVDYIQKDRERIVWECRLESTLARVTDPNMRKLFKTAEFRSIGHLLDVCHEYSHALENIVIPARDSLFSEAYLQAPSTSKLSGNDGNGKLLTNSSLDQNMLDLCNNTKAVKQALRDLSRETIIVNGQILPPVQSLKELVSLLKERLNSRPIKLREKKIGQVRRVPKPNEIASETEEGLSSGEVTSSSDNDNDFVSSGNEGDKEDKPYSARRKGSISISDNASVGSSGSSETKTLKRRQFNVDAIDILTRRLLIAASRTRGGGDAFFIVQDLFGGEGVQVVPSRVQTKGPYVSGSIAATIELTVRLASITIKCHSKFDVYPANVDECEPYIQLNTSTSETIELQEVRVDDTGLELELPIVDGENSQKPTKVMLKEKTGDVTGKRILSIKPAKYEEVENWHTPS